MTLIETLLAQAVAGSNKIKTLAFHSYDCIVESVERIERDWEKDSYEDIMPVWDDLLNKYNLNPDNKSAFKFEYRGMICYIGKFDDMFMFGFNLRELGCGSWKTL